jgi:ATP-dependent RNA helicase DOB1
MAKTIRKPENILPFLQNPGRFLDISIDGENYGWGILVSCKKVTAPGTGSAGSAGKLASLVSKGPQHSLDVLLACVDRHFDDDMDEKEKKEDIADLGLLWRGSSRHCRPVKEGSDDSSAVSVRVFTVGLDAIDRISAVRIFLPQDVHPAEKRKDVAARMKEVKKRFPEGVPLLDPIKELGIKGDDFSKLLGRAETLSERMSQHKLFTDYPEEERLQLVNAYRTKAEFLDQALVIRREARACQTIVMKEELKKMKRVLRQLGHVDANGVIQTKGRTACVSTHFQESL